LTHEAVFDSIAAMLAIRLKRVGRKNDPSFRITVQDHRRSPKRTRGLVEYLGSYDARKGKPIIDGERVKYWMSQGAKPSPTVHNLLVDAKIITGKKVNAHNKKTKPKKEEPKVEEQKVAAPVSAAAETPKTEAPVAETAEEAKAE
jgi:small subunit ribosomal protein S16